MKLVVGLGNPGSEYNNTRHNIGFMSIDSILNYYNITLDCNKFNGDYTIFKYNDEKIIFLKPLKYMNLSGEVIKSFIDYYKISVDDVLVFCDDLDTNIGSLRIRFQGSSGGHNGLKNIEDNLLTKNYKRIRIGISNNKEKDKKDYVLGHFSKEDLEMIKPLISKIPQIFEDYLNISFENLMNKYN